MLYSPLLPLTVVRVPCRFGEVTVIVAPGSGAPPLVPLPHSSN